MPVASRLVVTEDITANGVIEFSDDWFDPAAQDDTELLAVMGQADGDRGSATARTDDIREPPRVLAVPGAQSVWKHRTPQPGPQVRRVLDDDRSGVVKQDCVVRSDLGRSRRPQVTGAKVATWASPAASAWCTP